MAKKYKWTVSILAQVNEDDSWEYENFKETIENIKNPDLRFIIFQFNQKVQQSEALLIGQTEIPKSTPKSGTKNTKNYNQEKLDEGKPKLTAIKDHNPEDSLYKPGDLIDFFKKKVLTEESDYHMLITWGHGSGLGFFTHDASAGTKTRNDFPHGLDDKYLHKQNRRKFNAKQTLLNLHVANLSLSKNELYDLRFSGNENIQKYFPTKSDEFKNRTENLLSAEDLASILSKSFGQEKKVNILIANNCWVNMFEVGWALRNNVDMFVAPQTVVPFAGIDYYKFFKALKDRQLFKDVGDPHLTYRKLALNITDNLTSKYVIPTDTVVYADKDENDFEQKRKKFVKDFRQRRWDVDIRQLSISANYLKEYEELAKIIKELCNHLIEKLRSPDDNVKKYYQQRIDIARSYCGDLTQKGASYIDFTNFFSELIKSFQGKDPGILRKIYYKFFHRKNSALLSILNPGDLFRFMPEYFYSQSPQMFSIFFPSRIGRSAAEDKILENYFNKSSDFQQSCKWIDFIKTYLNWSDRKSSQEEGEKE